MQSASGRCPVPIERGDGLNRARSEHRFLVGLFLEFPADDYANATHEQKKAEQLKHLLWRNLI